MKHNGTTKIQGNNNTMAALVHGWSVNTATRVAGVAARSAVASTQAWRGLASSSSSSSSDSDAAASTPQLTHATLNPRVLNVSWELSERDCVESAAQLAATHTAHCNLHCRGNRRAMLCEEPSWTVR